MASPIEQSDLYQRSRKLGGQTWRIVAPWSAFAQRTVGEQFVRSMDSVAANLVEGDGRGSDRDAARFFVIARASAREARHWLDVAAERELLEEETARAMLAELTNVVKMLNGLIAYRKREGLKESSATYDAQHESDPFTVESPLTP